jgi:hypothetical protein
MKYSRKSKFNKSNKRKHLSKFNKANKRKHLSKFNKFNKFNKSNKRKHLSKQTGGFIGTMFNVAMAPVKMIGGPLIKKLGNMIASNNGHQMNNGTQMNNGQQMNNTPQMNNSQQMNNMVDHGTLNNIRMNNSHINTIKQLSSYGYDNNTMNSYIKQLQHINI